MVLPFRSAIVRIGLAGDQVVAGRPRHLQDDHALGARVRADDLGGQADHVERAAQERRFAGAVIPHLLDEIVAGRKAQVEPLLLEDRARPWWSSPPLA